MGFCTDEFVPQKRVQLVTGNLQSDYVGVKSTL